jgi:small subunit ribosomal protein S5
MTAPKKDEKTEFSDVKKTVEAHKTFDEEKAEKESSKTEEVTEKMIKEEKNLEKEKKEVDSKSKEEKTSKKSFEEENLLSAWEPKTKLGRDVKNTKIRDIDEILDANKKILEAEIVDFLIPITSDLVSIGQAKGKFGGGKRRAWRQTQKKTKEGNIPSFSTMAVIGDGKGHIGIGEGKAKETLPARDKAIRQAKLNLIKVIRACSGFDCACDELHTVPFKVTGKAGSVRVILIPAPQGTGLVVANELKKILKLAGIKDVYSKTFGRKRTSFNLIKACFDALKKTNLDIK